MLTVLPYKILGNCECIESHYAVDGKCLTRIKATQKCTGEVELNFLYSHNVKNNLIIMIKINKVKKGRVKEVEQISIK